MLIADIYYNQNKDTSMQTEDQLTHICLKKGASNSCIISADQIKFEREMRAYCEVNQCGYFGKNYACPPLVGEIETLATDARKYRSAIVYQTTHHLTDSTDKETIKRCIQAHNSVANKIAKEVSKHYESHLDLRAGPCTVCPVCAIIDQQPCQYPEKKRASLEAYGINVAALAATCNMDYRSDKNTINFFGAFLLP